MRKPDPFVVIQIAPMPPYKLNEATVIVDALELNRTKDPSRFRRIERHIKRITIANCRRFLGA